MRISDQADKSQLARYPSLETISRQAGRPAASIIEMCLIQRIRTEFTEFRISTDLLSGLTRLRGMLGFAVVGIFSRLRDQRDLPDNPGYTGKVLQYRTHQQRQCLHQ